MLVKNIQELKYCCPHIKCEHSVNKKDITLGSLCDGKEYFVLENDVFEEETKCEIISGFTLKGEHIRQYENDAFNSEFESLDISISKIKATFNDGRLDKYTNDIMDDFEIDLTDLYQSNCITDVCDVEKKMDMLLTERKIYCKSECVGNDWFNEFWTGSRDSNHMPTENLMHQEDVGFIMNEDGLAEIVDLKSFDSANYICYCNGYIGRNPKFDTKLYFSYDYVEFIRPMGKGTPWDIYEVSVDYDDEKNKNIEYFYRHKIATEETKCIGTENTQLYEVLYWYLQEASGYGYYTSCPQVHPKSIVSYRASKEKTIA